MRRLPLRSPPRVRGKDPPAAAMQGCPGITPACAGKSHSVTDANASSWDHPRVCGEKVSSTSPIKCLKGSPPRMRGKVPQPGVEGCRLGITPAYAGKRGIKLSIASMIWDHPRVCGEKMVSMIPHRRSLGSPPRVRGKGSGTGGFQSLQGITPAYAGKRDRPRSGPGTTRDHPRVCGEKVRCLSFLGSL